MNEHGYYATEIARGDHMASEALAPTFASAPVLAERPEQVIARIKEGRALVIQIQKELMRPGVHFGIIPGTEKASLLKPGADLLNQAFRLSPREELVEDLSGPDERRFRVTIGLYDSAGRRLGFGIGVASTSEERYRWRKAYRNEYDAAPADRRRTKDYPRRDGGGTDTTFQIRTEPADTENTALQMASKRALVQATRQVHAVSDVFADIEAMELSEEERDSLVLGGRKKPQQPRSRSAGNGSTKTGPPPAPAGEREPGADDAPAPSISAEEWAAVRAVWENHGTSAAVISEAQQKRLFGIAISRGWSGEEVAAALRDGLGVERNNDGVFAIPRGKTYDAVVGVFDNPRQA